MHPRIQMAKITRMMQSTAEMKNEVSGIELTQQDYICRADLKVFLSGHKPDRDDGFHGCFAGSPPLPD